MSNFNANSASIIFQEVYISGKLPTNIRDIKNILEEKKIYLSMEEISENVQKLVDRGSFGRTTDGFTIPRKVLDILYKEK